MKTTNVLAKNLHAGDYLVEGKGTRLAGRHICEVHVERRLVRVVVNERVGFGHRKFARTRRVRIVK